MWNAVTKLRSERSGFGSQTIPVAGPSKATVCGRSPAMLAGSNPSGGIDVCVVCFK
jgi:hypothetical protein